jgi:hypothetical protein
MPREPIPYLMTVIISRIVPYTMNRPCQWIQLINLFKQTNRRRSMDTLRKVHRPLQTADVHHAIDVHKKRPYYTLDESLFAVLLKVFEGGSDASFGDE